MGIPEGGILSEEKKKSSIKGLSDEYSLQSSLHRVPLLLSTTAKIQELQVQVTHYHRQKPVTCSSEIAVSLRKISHFREKGNEKLFPILSIS